jgi:hypothetical protein
MICVLCRKMFLFYEPSPFMILENSLEFNLLRLLGISVSPIVAGSGDLRGS